MLELDRNYSIKEIGDLKNFGNRLCDNRRYLPIGFFLFIFHSPNVTG